MTFAARTLGYFVNSAVVSSLGTLYAYDAPSSGPAYASITFNTDGTISYVGDGSTGVSNWYTPTTTNVGSSYWIKFTTTSGSPWTGGLTSGTIYALSSARTVVWQQILSGGGKTGTASVNIYADAGGTALVGTGTINAQVLTV